MHMWQLLIVSIAAEAAIISLRDDGQKRAICPQAAATASQALGGIDCSAPASANSQSAGNGPGTTLNSPTSASVNLSPTVIGLSISSAIPTSNVILSTPPDRTGDSGGISSKAADIVPPIRVSGTSGYTMSPGGPAVTVNSHVFSYDTLGVVYEGSSEVYSPPQSLGGASINAGSESALGSVTIPQQVTSSHDSPVASNTLIANSQTNNIASNLPRLTTLVDSSTTAIYGYDYLTQYSSLRTPTVISTSYAVVKTPLATPVLTTGSVHVGSGGVILYPTQFLQDTRSHTPVAAYTNLISLGDDDDDDDDNDNDNSGVSGGGGGSGHKCPAILRFLCGDTGTSASDNGSDVDEDDQDKSKSSPSKSSSCTVTNTATACSKSCAPGGTSCTQTCSAIATGCSATCTGSSCTVTTTGNTFPPAYGAFHYQHALPTGSARDAQSLAVEELSFLSKDFPDLITAVLSPEPTPAPAPTPSKVPSTTFNLDIYGTLGKGAYPQAGWEASLATYHEDSPSSCPPKATGHFYTAAKGNQDWSQAPRVWKIDGPVTMGMSECAYNGNFTCGKGFESATAHCLHFDQQPKPGGNCIPHVGCHITAAATKDSVGILGGGH